VATAARRWETRTTQGEQHLGGATGGVRPVGGRPLWGDIAGKSTLGESLLLSRSEASWGASVGPPRFKVRVGGGALDVCGAGDAHLFVSSCGC